MYLILLLLNTRTRLKLLNVLTRLQLRETFEKLLLLEKLEKLEKFIVIMLRLVCTISFPCGKSYEAIECGSCTAEVEFEFPT